MSSLHRRPGAEHPGRVRPPAPLHGKAFPRFCFQCTAPVTRTDCSANAPTAPSPPDRPAASEGGSHVLPANGSEAKSQAQSPGDAKHHQERHKPPAAVRWHRLAGHEHPDCHGITPQPSPPAQHVPASSGSAAQPVPGLQDGPAANGFPSGWSGARAAAHAGSPGATSQRPHAGAAQG